MSLATTRLSFKKLSPSPDPVYGVPSGRSSHGVSVIEGGSKLVLYGGEHIPRTPIDSSQSLWFCSLSENDQQWKCIIPKGSIPPPRVAHAQTSIGDTIYIFGGRSGITMKEKAMNDLYKLEGEKWTLIPTTGSLPPKRSFHRMVAKCVNNTHVLYVFGGCGEDGRLSDLFKIEILDGDGPMVWEQIPDGSFPLKGRGGANLLAFSDKLGVVGGFAGEETNDAKIFNLADNSWEENIWKLDMRARSVCISGVVAGMGVIFGGEVDPSERGHEGAGGFGNDVVLIDSETFNVRTIEPTKDFPEPRGWSDGSVVNESDSKGSLYFFGGLSGDDTNPKRLCDLWKLEIYTNNN